MANFLNSNPLSENIDNMKLVSTIFQEPFDKGLKTIASAKALHDHLETYFIPNMNFDKINKVTEKFINKLLKYEEEYLKEK